MTREDRLQDLAARIVDQSPIDWDTETGDDEMSTEIQNLRMLERIRTLHRNAAPDPAVGEAGAAAGAAVPAAAPSAPGHDLESTPTRPIPGEIGGGSRAATGLRPGARWGPLELEELVGSGSYGEVWRAWDPSLQTHVALKLLFPRGQRTEDVLREARQMARVRHANVVQVHGAAVHGGHVGIWYGFVVGKTLERQLEEQGPMGPREAAAVGIDLLHAVAAVHAAGLVHRDIKTSNVMREAGGRIVLMDFGTVVDRQALASLSVTDAFTGTAPYMAPEIFAGRPPSVSSDLYALGVLLYRLVTDRYPHADRARNERPGETTPLRDARPDLPAAYVRVVERAMAESPVERYASAGEMERDLAGLFGESSSGKVAVARPGRRRWRWAAVFAAPVAAVAAWLAWTGLTGGDLEVEAALYRDGTGGSQERLAPGGRVRPGDDLFLELKATRDVYVYVLAEDRKGHAYLLFPLSGVRPSNPLHSGRTHRLPGLLEGEEQRWGVDTAGGEESLYVIASRRPLEDLESEVSSLPAAGAGVPRPITPERIRRGIGELKPAPRSAGGDSAGLSALFGRLAGAAQGSHDLWTWSIRLENPSP